MIYSYICDGCGSAAEMRRTMKDGPPAWFVCEGCGQEMRRDWKTDLPLMNTSECRDHGDIPFEKRVCDARLHPFGVGQAKAQRMEAAYAAQHQQKKRIKRETGGNKKMQMTASYPAELYHGKIRETADRNYWDDPKNRKRHKAWEL
jgi:hypothetical protein